MPLESDASAELGEAEITVPSAESFGGQQAVGPAGTDDRETHRDSATKQADTLALHYNPPPPSTHSNTDHNLQVTIVSQLAIFNHPALLRFDFCKKDYFCKTLVLHYGLAVA